MFILISSIVENEQKGKSRVKFILLEENRVGLCCFFLVLLLTNWAVVAFWVDAVRDYGLSLSQSCECI